MKRNRNIQKLSRIVCIVLIAAMALCITGCGEAAPQEQPSTDLWKDCTELGEGATTFRFLVEDLEGKQTPFLIHTDKTLVGEALQEVGLIEGEEGPYGLYVKTVNGTTLDYDTDGAYWAFYVNGEYGLTGVDQTQIDPESTYSFKAEK